MRRNQFTVSAESVQGNAGAEVTFRAVKVKTIREYRTSPELTDYEMLKRHIVDWSGVVDDEGVELPFTPDEPDKALGELYGHEMTALATMLFQGPDGENAKN